MVLKLPPRGVFLWRRSVLSVLWFACSLEYSLVTCWYQTIVDVFLAFDYNLAKSKSNSKRFKDWNQSVKLGMK